MQAGIFLFYLPRTSTEVHRSVKMIENHLSFMMQGQVATCPYMVSHLKYQLMRI